MDWSELYPEFFAPLTQNQSHDDPEDKKEKRAQAQVEFADIGCGYGGLLGNTSSFSGARRGLGSATSAGFMGATGDLSPSDIGDISVESLPPPFYSGCVAFALEKGGGCLKCLRISFVLSGLGPYMSPISPARCWVSELVSTSVRD